MADWRARTGLLLGLAGAAAFLAAGGAPTPLRAQKRLPPHGPLLSDCDGPIKALVIQYVPEAAGIVEATYRQFLRHLPKEVLVYVVCPGRAAFDDLRARVEPVQCRLILVRTGHPMTCWSRDRWLAFAPRRRGGPALLLTPREETGEAVWPERKGDKRIASDLSRALRGRVVAEQSELAFDGGDFVADAETVFVTPAVVERNVGRTVASVEELRRLLAAILKRKIVLLPEAPPHHAGMFMMLAGNRTALVGDPSLARRLLNEAEQSSHPSLPLDRPDFSEGTQRRFDAVAATCAASGYRVVRIPVVPAADGRTYLTYLNVILDQRRGRRTVYMPVYRDAAILNDAAAAIWQGLGCDVRRVDCTHTYRHYGSLRCLVNVMERS